MSNLLFEIGTEELPAGFIEPGLSQLTANFIRRANDLKISHGEITVFGTPRRLAIFVENLAEKQEDIREELIGPSTKAGLDSEGKPTKAAIGFARSKGAEPESLTVIETAKGDYLMLIRETVGQPVQSLLAELLTKLILDLNFPKSMRWGNNQLSFARPIQWLLAMNDNTVIEMEHEGIYSSNVTRGHRFLNNFEIVITNADSYEELLRENNVIADIAKRKELVRKTITDAVAGSDVVSKGKVFVDDNLLATVTNLIETPIGICGSFDNKFLQLPDDVLITSMREHQKYFPVIDSNGKLMSGFVAVNNTKTDDPSLTRKGHQRVLRARLEDALFFYNGDKSRKLEDLVPSLKGIIFQAKLGTMLEKNERIVKLTRMLSEMLEPSLVEDACRAAKLCKADLLTDMVGEFPSLQGVMGHAYAQFEQEKANVAVAIREHYMPKRAGAQGPSEPTGALVGLADRFDTLAGCFGIGQVPSGTADPFGLRRISLAILQLLKEFNYTVSLREVIRKALALYGDKVDGGSSTVESVLNFIEGRFRNDCIAKGFDAEAVAAATAVGFDDANDCTARITALADIKGNEAFAVLASAFKRIRNIVKDNDTTQVDDSIFTEKAEENLYSLLLEISAEIKPLLTDKDYSASLELLMQLKEPVDLFFDNVMVMDKDDKIKQNRLNLLTALGEMVLQVGDISKMQEA